MTILGKLGRPSILGFQQGRCYELNVCVPAKFICKILITGVMVFRSAVIGKWLLACLLKCLSCATFCNPMNCTLPGSFVHGDSPSKKTGVSCLALLQGIFPTQESNPCLYVYLRLQVGSLPLVPLGKPRRRLVLSQSTFFVTDIKKTTLMLCCQDIVNPYGPCALFGSFSFSSVFPLYILGGIANVIVADSASKKDDLLSKYWSCSTHKGWFSHKGNSLWVFWAPKWCCREMKYRILYNFKNYDAFTKLD